MFVSLAIPCNRIPFFGPTRPFGRGEGRGEGCFHHPSFPKFLLQYPLVWRPETILAPFVPLCGHFDSGIWGEM